MAQTVGGSRPRTHEGETRFPSLDPRSGEVIDYHQVDDEAAVRAAVVRAREAALWWGGLGFAQRRRRLLSWRRALTRRIDELAGLITAETGKPRDDARLECVLVVAHLDWAARNAERVLRRRRVGPGLLMLQEAATVEYQPYGVIGVIGPWNYPAHTPMGSIGYALAAGNAVVFKPSELTPGVGRALAESLAAVVPEYPLLQVVTGFGETGAALCRAGVDKLAFTGSTGTAKKVMATCAETLTPVVLECGGKDALLVDADADLAAAADAAVWGGMSNAGQSCIGVERVYVVDGVAAEFTARVLAQARRLRTGGEPSADLGPITRPDQLEVIRDHLADALARGGTALLGGAESVRPPYVEPVVLADVPETSPAVTEETFGPVLTVHRVPNLDDAVARANAGRYGLGAAVFSARRGAEIAARLRCGMVTINSALSYAAVPSLPFGGVGDSGFGRIHGADGLREFSRAKAVTRRRFPPAVRVLTFARPAWAMRVLLRIVRVLYGR
ncbi:MAG: aldehyde dehydrogenase family protein [Pseudonocardiales bacterium]|nr:aldehyde dehydrogenase family protein [Pseudonocardiales bacterium]MBV9028778.1 aldehyde dehydrogenase family protein [Pseudonocardiales bacterium]